MNILGMRIKEERKVKGLSQLDLAQKLGVVQHVVSRYENNIIRPSLEVLVLLADILEVSTDYLLGRQDF